MAITDLALGAALGAASSLSLTRQLAGETEEERKKREQEDAMRRTLGPLASSPVGGLASRMLGLGSYGSANGGRGGY